MAITINVNLDEILAALKDDLDFTGNADKYIKVNATADGFEFAAVSAGATWGSITGTLSDQTDLQTALDAKYDASNPSGYITGIAWGAITGTLSSQTDLQTALDAKANLSGAAFTGDVSVTTSGSGDTLQLTNSGSGTTLNILNSGSGDFFKIDTNKLVVSNNGNLAVDTNTLFVDATNNRVGIGTATPSQSLEVAGETKVSSSSVIVSEFNGTGSSTRVAINNTRPVPNCGLGLYANSVLKWSLASFGATSDFTFFNDGINSSAILIKGNNNNVLIGTTTDAGYKLNVNGNGRFIASSTSTIPLTVTAAAGQTANLLEVKNSGGTNLFHITASGGIATNGNAGFTGTGSYTNFTIENGIITNASLT